MAANNRLEKEPRDSTELFESFRKHMCWHIRITCRPHFFGFVNRRRPHEEFQGARIFSETLAVVPIWSDGKDKFLSLQVNLAKKIGIATLGRMYHATTRYDEALDAYARADAGAAEAPRDEAPAPSPAPQADDDHEGSTETTSGLLAAKRRARKRLGDE